MPGFVEAMVEQWKPETKAERVVQEFRDFFRKRYDDDAKAGKKRKLSHLSSMQSSLSVYKTALQSNERIKPTKEFLDGLHITQDEAVKLAYEKNGRLRDKSIDLPKIHGDQMIMDARKWLKSPDALHRVVAIAMLSGRRMSEIVATAKFGLPRQNHTGTSNEYWTCFTGLLKQRGNDRCVEAPLFAKRSEITESLNMVREAYRGISRAKINATLAKPISRLMARFAPDIHNLHAFRKLYAILTHHYFNERSCSLPRITNDYLGHVTGPTASSLPYANMALAEDSVGGIDFTR
jgi:hypothetical protein